MHGNMSLDFLKKFHHIYLSTVISEVAVVLEHAKGQQAGWGGLGGGHLDNVYNKSACAKNRLTLSDLAGPVSQLLIPAMEMCSALASALLGTSAMFICALSPPTFAIPVPHSVRFVWYSPQTCISC